MEISSYRLRGHPDPTGLEHDVARRSGRTVVTLNRVEFERDASAFRIDLEKLGESYVVVSIAIRESL